LLGRVFTAGGCGCTDTFFLAGTNRRPLAIGISRELLAADTGLSRHQIGRALAT
jgi:hypothetical protein